MVPVVASRRYRHRRRRPVREGHHPRLRRRRKGKEVVEKHGADILRLWVSMIDYRGDIAMSHAIVSRIADAYRKIRNTARFLLMNLYDFDPARDAVPLTELEDLD